MTKYRNRSSPADVFRATAPGTPTVRPQPTPTDPDIYIPPPRLDTASTTQSQVFTQETRTLWDHPGDLVPGKY